MRTDMCKSQSAMGTCEWPGYSQGGGDEGGCGGCESGLMGLALPLSGCECWQSKNICTTQRHTRTNTHTHTHTQGAECGRLRNAAANVNSSDSDASSTSTALALNSEVNAIENNKRVWSKPVSNMQHHNIFKSPASTLAATRTAQHLQQQRDANDNVTAAATATATAMTATATAAAFTLTWKVCCSANAVTN